MNYYTREKQAARIGVFQASYYAGSMFSGILQTAICKKLNGTHDSFQWLFIVNKLMTIAAGTLGYLILPDTPRMVVPRSE
jgi:ACS family pantothenate transporter-like MFS transporter